MYWEYYNGYRAGPCSWPTLGQPGQGWGPVHGQWGLSILRAACPSTYWLASVGTIIYTCFLLLHSHQYSITSGVVPAENLLDWPFEAELEKSCTYLFFLRYLLSYAIQTNEYILNCINAAPLATERK